MKKTIRASQFVFAVVLSLFAATTCVADLIWSSSFETSPEDDWNHIYQLGTITYNAAAAHSGARGSDHYVPSDGTFVISRGRAQLDEYIFERQIRMWVNVDGFVVPDGTERSILRDTGADTEVYLRNVGSQYYLVLHVMSGDLREYSTPVAIDRTKWHQIDMYIKSESVSGAQDGIAKWWLDGIERYSRTDCGLFQKTHSWVMGIASPIAGDETEYGHVYVDDVTAYNTMTPPVVHSLDVASTQGGSVTSPGEGTFEYLEDEVVNISAEEETGYRFEQWSGTAVVSGKVTDPLNPTTEVVLDGDYDIEADFVLIDGDLDGLPDDWEQQIVDADPNDEIETVEDVLPEDDYDEDGNSNGTEQVAGTDPIDEESFFAVTNMARSLYPLSMKLEWTSVEGKYYAVYYSDDEFGAAMSWTLAQDMIPASGTGSNTWTDDGSLTSPVPDDNGLLMRHYRVLVYQD